MIVKEDGLRLAITRLIGDAILHVRRRVIGQDALHRDRSRGCAWPGAAGRHGEWALRGGVEAG
jgi:hypothetical protein